VEQLKISVVIVCYNSVKTIEQAICSVVGQSCSEMEFIVIDGKSTDGTVKIIEKYKDRITYGVSEADEGIYDAMNKGIMQASGDYIYFLGADDCLLDFNVMERVSRYLRQHKDVDVLCGRVWAIDDGFSGLQRILGRKLEKEAVLSGEISPHQGMFVKTSLLKSSRFDLHYKIAADYAFFLRAFLMGKKFVFVDEIIAFYSLNGQSSYGMDCFDEYRQILQENKIEEKYIQAFIVNKIKYQRIKKIIKKCIGIVHMEKIIQRFRGYTKHTCRMPRCRWCK